MNYKEFKQFTIDCENKRSGNLKGYDCPICKNKGYIYYLDKYDNESAKECECMNIRYSTALAKDSGLGNILRLYSFSRYIHNEKWQDDIYIKAQLFAISPNAYCFYIGGQSGSGKTHICIALAREFIKARQDVQYAVWNDTVTSLKQDCFDDRNNYKRNFNLLKNTSVLVIDDLFKTKPTTSDIDKTFQLINYRYNLSRLETSKRYVTIISSEKTLSELSSIDISIAGRIAELAQKYVINIPKDSNKNLRFNHL